MPKASIKICTTLHNILKDESFNNFQIMGLRDTYIAVSASSRSIGDTYNFIYRQVHRLVLKGILDKNVDEQKKETTYQKTAKFSQTNFILQKSEASTSTKESPTRNTQKSNAIHQLEERLKQSEIDLFTSIGESEEYMRLYQSFPDMKAHLESQYLQARETSSKLLGQIKAIKSAITYQQK